MTYPNHPINPLPLSVQESNFNTAVAAGLPELIAESMAIQSNRTFDCLPDRSPACLTATFAVWMNTIEGHEFWALVTQSIDEELGDGT